MSARGGRRGASRTTCLRFSSSFSSRVAGNTYAARKFQDHAAPPVRVSLRGWSIFFSRAANTGTVVSGGGEGREGDDRASGGSGGKGGGKYISLDWGRASSCSPGRYYFVVVFLLLRFVGLFFPLFIYFHFLVPDEYCFVFARTAARMAGSDCTKLTIN